MTRKLLFCCAFLVAVSTRLLAYPRFPGQKHKHPAADKTTTASPAENDYDINYLKFNISVSDTSVYVAGDVSTTARVVAATMSNYVFELDTTLNIDSAKINGTLLPATNAGAIRTIALPAALAAGSVFTAQIYYHGLPPGGSGGFFNGITHMLTSGGTNVVFTISDPYVARNWWPSKQNIDDKIDSVDMFVTVPQGVRDGSNGVLVSIDSTSNPGYWKFHWHTNYAIDYYLISIAVARYAEYRNYWHFTGSTDSVLIQNFFTDTATFNPAYKANFDSIGMYIDYFSTLYGRYPFWQEKYGICYTTLPGGMENQTMTTIGVPNTYIIAHELCHQWFGDHVTYRTWADVWLSEGFATFSEQLFLTHFWSAAAGKAHRIQLLNNVFTRPCGRICVSDTSTSDSLFDQTTVYNKAQAVITMLRYMAPSDSVFFQALRTYQQTYAFGLASTADLKAIFEAADSTNLDTFFNQWIYGRGYPFYKISWDQVGSTVYVKLIQTPSCPSYTNHFSTQLELQLHAASADTFIQVYNTLDTQVFAFNWSPAMTSVLLNPDALTICKLLPPVVHDATLGTGMLQPQHFRISPNPTKNSWEVENMREGLSLELCDVNGRALWHGTSRSGSNTIPGQQLPAGNYMLRMGAGRSAESIKLVHW